MNGPIFNLECDECGGVAILADEGGAFPEGERHCAECECPGFVSWDDQGTPFWYPQPDLAGRS